MPKKGTSKGKKKDQWPGDEETEQQLTENMKKLMSDDTDAASSVCRQKKLSHLQNGPQVSCSSLFQETGRPQALLSV